MPATSLFPSQWSCLLKNVGAWQGSFSRFSPQAERLSETPSVVTLVAEDEDQQIRQTLAFWDAQGQPLPEQVLVYRSLNQSVLLTASGGFSQGAMQWGPFSDFGAELSLLEGDQRRRVIPIFSPIAGGITSRLAQITLICERRLPQTSAKMPPAPHDFGPTLTLADLAGIWSGVAIALNPRGFATSAPSHEEIKVEGAQGEWHSHPDLAASPASFPEGSPADAQVQVTPWGWEQAETMAIALPGQIWCRFPKQLPTRQPFFLELGWLISPTERQCLRRTFDAKGAWTGLTWFRETRQGEAS